jgi:uncharacterized protein (DUF58 family)
MMSSVPQFVDVEDKIAGPLTWKQLLWMIAMGAVLLVLFTTFGTTIAIIFGIPVVILFLALAFYKPNGFTLSSFIGQAVLFLFRPKVAVWERPVMPMVSVKPRAENKESKASFVQPEKHLTRGTLKELARMMDNQGRE